MKILNLPNINDSALDNNYCAIHELFPDVEIISQPYDCNVLSPSDLLLSYFAEEDIDLIVGNGFGAFLGYIIGAELNVKTLLTNPYIPATDFTIIELYPYRQELERLWEKYQNKNRNCHILLSVFDTTINTNKLFDMLKDTADIRLLCTPTSTFNSSEYKKWIHSYL